MRSLWNRDFDWDMEFSWKRIMHRLRRHIIILGLLLLFCSPVLAVDRLPVWYECSLTSGEEMEKQFCDRFYDALGRTGVIEFVPRSRGVFFHMIVLPTVRDNYTGVALTVNFIYPPLDGLALSAYSAVLLVGPDGLTDENLETVSGYVITSVSKWMLWADEKILAIKSGGEYVLETTE